MTDKRTQENIRALVPIPRKSATLPKLTPQGGIPAQRGVAQPDAVPDAAPSGGGGGMPETLTEVPGSRLHYPAEINVPVTGYFAFLTRPVRELQLAHAGGTMTVKLERHDYPEKDLEP